MFFITAIKALPTLNKPCSRHLNNKDHKDQTATTAWGEKKRKKGEKKCGGGEEGSL